MEHPHGVLRGIARPQHPQLGGRKLFLLLGFQKLGELFQLVDFFGAAQGALLFLVQDAGLAVAQFAEPVALPLHHRGQRDQDQQETQETDRHQRPQRAQVFDQPGIHRGKGVHGSLTP